MACWRRFNASGSANGESSGVFPSACAAPDNICRRRNNSICDCPPLSVGIPFPSSRCDRVLSWETASLCEEWIAKRQSTTRSASLQLLPIRVCRRSEWSNVATKGVVPVGVSRRSDIDTTRGIDAAGDVSSHCFRPRAQHKTSSVLIKNSS